MKSPKEMTPHEIRQELFVINQKESLDNSDRTRIHDLELEYLMRGNSELTEAAEEDRKAHT